MTSQFQLEEKGQSSSQTWKILCGLLVLIVIGLVIALIFVLVIDDSKDCGSCQNTVQRSNSDNTYVCGEGDSNPNNNIIDLEEPTTPGPFHDLTKHEMRELRKFLERDSDIQAVSMKDYSKVTINSSYIFNADLWLPKKADALNFLDQNGPRPKREARVMMFRGDKNPPVVEEMICGPLPQVANCELLNLTSRRNPVEFTARPFSNLAVDAAYEFLEKVENVVGHILMESYNATFNDCNNGPCLDLNWSPTGFGLTGTNNTRLIWFWAVYDVPYSLLHVTDFGFQVDWTNVDPGQWSVRKVWYGSQAYDSLEELSQAYDNDTITNKTKLTRPEFSENLYSSLHRRGPFSPPKVQRPPRIVEPDGKRYSIKGREVDYLGWKFNFRMSSFSGPQLYNIRFQEERIAYELSLSEIAAFYSGDSPVSQSANYVDSGEALFSRALVRGGDCPDSATLIPYSVWNQNGEEPGQYDSGFCMFEHNNNYPLRRHLTYPRPYGFYGGMLDSVLTLRSIIVVANYDYVVDFIFHQNGALEVRLMSTGYIQGNFYREIERKYGVRLEETLTGNLHHHIFHIKADLDVSGTSNRYETLNIVPEDTKLSWDSSRNFSQAMFVPDLKRTELEALYKYDINKPKYHIVHNNDVKNKWGERKAYSIHLSGMSRTLMPEGLYNEPVISWARNQMAVTQRKESEFLSSSNYGMYDTLNPVVDFSKFYEDNETIVDQDLVFWLTLGLHHIPHTEDLPVTPTTGNHLGAWFLPNNFFNECPSMGSRDAIFVDYKDHDNPELGLTLERNGNTRDQCLIPMPTLEEDIETNPDIVIGSRRKEPTY